MSFTTQATSTLNDATDTDLVIITKRLLIRPTTFADASDMARLANNVNIAANMRNSFPSPYHLKHVEAWLAFCAKNPGNDFAICKAEDGSYIGNIGITRGTDVQYRTWELGYWIGEDFWRQGYASKVLEAFGKFCFQHDPSVLRLEASVVSTNVASRRVLEKAGFTYEGTKRQGQEKKGVVTDLHFFSLLRHESIA
ncbi:gcn5-related n-acetyltransferase [Colletotrichum sojae]|uniref:Gcn5-related n-acetyltransferase n=1 Tax=Colletotrichum sojae TaxID=2175907 RepID=A0A8H6MWP4_9PEZI|nr:gcn5-related n-acetyltransferase [Colletotrichum sojae]